MDAPRAENVRRDAQRSLKGAGPVCTPNTSPKYFLQKEELDCLPRVVALNYFAFFLAHEVPGRRNSKGSAVAAKMPETAGVVVGVGGGRQQRATRPSVSTHSCWQGWAPVFLAVLHRTGCWPQSASGVLT